MKNLKVCVLPYTKLKCDVAKDTMFFVTLRDMFKETITPEEIGKMEMVAFPGKIHVITEPGPAFDRAIRYLRREKIIGFDTETRPTFMSHQARYDVSLLQLSGRDHSFLFRINKLGMNRRLCNLLADKNIIKVGAAVHDDIRGLQKHSPFTAASFVDLQKIVSEWGIRDKSVKKMAGIILGIRISKSQQLSNWEAESLSDAQQLYAATDAWVCLEMYRVLQKSEKAPLSAEQPAQNLQIQ